MAKNIPMCDDSSRVTIVVNRNVLSTAADESTVSSIFTLAHELTHPVINRMRAASGVLAGVPFPSRTPTECARSITRIAIDEYWTDCFAGIVLGFFAHVDRDGERVPLHQGSVMGGVDGYRNQLAHVLESYIHPGWPDLVESYQEHRMSLDVMWGRVVRETDQVFTLLAHAQSSEDGSQTGGPFVDGTTSDNPGVRLYLAPAWKRVMGSLDSMPFTLPLAEFAAADLAVTDAGEVALMTMWETLGLTFDEHEDRSYYIHVTAPTR